uniref:UPAR/Ly6 domain-containing protein n=1 Tax=Salarias fasciatus TaxID=181472 RepID=A0A672HY22_SALFA
MYLFSLILWIVFLPGVCSLKCHECASGLDEACKTQECSPGYLCAAMRITADSGDHKISEFNIKSCSPREQCIQGSVNYGPIRTVLTTKCCSTDFCNNQLAADTNHSNPNGKKCFSCDGEQCTETLNCLGNEDHCISATGLMGTMKGCASMQMCSAFNIPGVPHPNGLDFKCCQGDFCNNARDTSAGVLLLVVQLTCLALIF